MERKYTVGEVSRITGVSKDTLRFYDKIDLFKPKYVDLGNGYRYYTYDQFWRIDAITCLRRLNISIGKIKDILSSRNNDMVMELMKEHQKEALYLSEYYLHVAEDIDWYATQHAQIHEAGKGSDVQVRYLPERKVIYGANVEDAKAYHLKLQENCRAATEHHNSFRRKYGFVLDASWIKQDGFVKTAEYIEFFDDRINESVDPAYVMTLPFGKYACCVVNVVNDRTDFSVLKDWMEENKVTGKFVIADEIGLQLFEYLDYGYPCEVKVLLEY